MAKVLVEIIESERGWGQKVGEVKSFPTLAKAEAFIKKYNKPNHDDFKKTKTVPSWYMYARLK